MMEATASEIPEWKIRLAQQYFNNDKKESKPTTQSIPIPAARKALDSSDEDTEEEFKSFLAVSPSKRAIEIDQDFEKLIYDNDLSENNNSASLQSPQSLKTIAAAVVQNDSGYEGPDSVKKLFPSPSNSSAEQLEESSISEECTPKKLDLTPKTSFRKASLGIIEEVDEISAGATSTPKALNAKKIAAMFNREEESQGFMSVIEMLVMFVLACSIFFAMTMPLTGERTGGKYAAMEYYHKVHSNADCLLGEN